MRPKTIILFERIMFTTLALGLIQGFLSWNQEMALLAETNQGPFFAIFIMVFTFGLIGGLTLLISRRRSRGAMWISVILFLLGIPLFVLNVSRGLIFGSHLITFAQTLAQIVAYALLFTPSARAWMRGEKAEGELRDTFS